MKTNITVSTFLLGCLIPLQSFSENKINVVASIPALASLAQEIGGDKVSVKALAKGTMDPHFVEAKPNLILDLNRADILIYVGLGLEIGWLPPLVLNSRNSKIGSGQAGNLDASTVIHILKIPTAKVDRSMGDIHPQGNPHYWMIPKNGLAIATEITERLKKLEPRSTAYFDAQLATFAKKLADVESALAPKIAKLRGMKVVPYHDSFPYVSEWLGLQEVGYVENKPGIPPDPQHLVSLIENMKREKVAAIMMETFYNRSIAASVAEKTGAKQVDVPTNVGEAQNTDNYFDLVRAVVDSLSKAI